MSQALINASEQPRPHGRRVLVVDDSRMQRRILASQLARAGYEVLEAESGEQALLLCATEQVDLVLSDWVMPGMSGLDLCRAYRALPRDDYGYFVLLTSKIEKGEVARGLASGANDFLVKPVNGDELRARLAAGERILRMQSELKAKNNLLSSTLAELQRVYDSVDRDLREARKLQQSLLKDRHRKFGGTEVSLLLRPSGHVGGDLVGYFPINSRRVGLFGIDVSGHGITSALMTARLAGFLSGSSPEQNIALVLTDLGIYDARPPHEVAAYLNALVLEEMQTDSYFTLVYADVDLITGKVDLVQAGHPHPAVQRADGTIEYLGNGGLPVGLIEGAEYELCSTTLRPGDRLFLMSDGVTEAADARGALLGEIGLRAVMTRNAKLRGQVFLEGVMWDVSEFADGDLTDDVSAVLLEFNSAKENDG
ncbi:PP2C family protein-serine/threonine phosphatase [Phaeovulum sp.]|uniref:PP2C family protein-serine/threonine phosphatase n=1 Tax=Phaeovulum sp. TaxID=2934796 RepID=UPI00356191D7